MAFYLDIQIFSDLIRAKRGHRSLREIALITGISPSTISRVERGTVPDVATFLGLCDWLDVPPAEFIKNTQASGKIADCAAICVKLRTDKRLKDGVGNAIATLIEAFYSSS